MKSIFGAFLAVIAVAFAVPISAAPAQAGPALNHASDAKTSGITQVAEGITDISARRYYRRYGYGYRGGYYRPRYYRPYGYARPYGYGGYGGGYYRRPGIYLGF
ncbi:MAG TPA: hypothetical protein VGC86_16020 [Afipia sp.]